MSPKAKLRIHTALRAIAAAVILGTLGALLLQRSTPKRNIASSASPPGSDRQVFATYAGSQSCRDCHTNAYASWERSHHGIAERAFEPSDVEAFHPARAIKHGTQTSEATTNDRQFQLIAAARDGAKKAFALDRVIGVDPLIQYLVPEKGGRFQVTELAFDPHKREWFDVYGDEDRKPGEWGHWTGRGMTWNQMCAACHNTRLRKHYDPATDSYATSMVERGVGCESCHGGMADHVKWQRARPQPAKGDPTTRKLDRVKSMAACGACHARRSEITGEFKAGDSFHDHYLLTIPDESDLYFPDGQVRDENYEYTSFLGSKMFTAGVWCMDCHEPHSAKVKAQDNSLCMRCHSTPLPPAPKIVETAHSFHPAGKGGSKCVDCHMPQTTYMQRDARRDHGFTIPDPLLTQQFGIPNACNRCHTDKDAAWSLGHVEKWYGRRMERPSRARSQVIAKARRGETNAVPELTRLARGEKIDVWRASATRLLGTFAGVPDVKTALLQRAGDSNSLVRANAAQALGPYVHAQDAEAIAVARKLLTDDTRAVRIQAAWALHASIDTNSTVGRELFASLIFNCDQPAGAAQLGTFFLNRAEPHAALTWFEKAVRWDGHSAPLRDSLAVCYSALGRAADAVRELEAACSSAPRDAQLRYRLGLALSEAGQLNDAITTLEQTVKIDPQLASAWYNLGLGYAQLDRAEDALAALVRAESLEPSSPRAPYARATILARMGRADEARRAARRALELHRDFAEAEQLLRTLSER
ncbi:MAG TPA: ammonia-forming cytochrome c nitrite reductase subunit c552 [Candidatus Acidoferrum sp.]|nr:ammonia-forming cytochrome c nitrite reductase subunit c552 [Candidatus Acidoferrum sp.]